jgi:hypothetical protein
VGHLIDNPVVRALAVSLASYVPADRYIFFEFNLESATSMVYSENQHMRQLWKRAK